jgi:ParB/RepB/Spo0J family partition protein
MDLVDVDRIKPSSLNTRKRGLEKGMEELKASIEEHGLLQPVVVRRTSGSGEDTQYELVFGSRRLAAVKSLGWKQIPAQSKKLTRLQALELILIENNQRETIHPLDEAEGFRQMMEMAGCKPEYVSAKIKRSAGYVYQRLKLLEMVDEAKLAFESDQMSFAQALRVARLREEDQSRATQVLIRRDLTVRQLDRWIKDHVQQNLVDVPWNLKDSLMFPMGACSKCPKRTGAQPNLWEDLDSDRCLDSDCFDEKHVVWLIAKKEEMHGLKVLSTDMRCSDGGVLTPDKYVLVEDLSFDVPAAKQSPGIFFDGPRRGHLTKVTTNTDYVVDEDPEREGLVRSTEALLRLCLEIGELDVDWCIDILETASPEVLHLLEDSGIKVERAQRAAYLMGLIAIQYEIEEHEVLELASKHKKDWDPHHGE